MEKDWGKCSDKERQPSHLQLYSTLIVYLWKDKTPPNGYPGHDSKLQVMVCLQPWRNVEYPFIAIITRSTPIRSGSSSLGQIYRSNRTV